MTLTELAPNPLEKSRDTVEQYLRERLAATPAKVELRVALLGVRDMLWQRTTEPWQNELLEVDTEELLPIYLHDGFVLVGPHGSIRPCFHCLARRWQQLRTSEERDPLEAGRAVSTATGSPFMTTFGLEAVWQLVKQVVESPPEQQPVDRHGHPYVHQLRLEDLRIQRYPVVADSQCPRCSRPQADTAEQAKVVLQSRQKRAVDDFRLSPVDDYDLELEAYVNPVCGMAGTGAYPRMVSTTTANARGHLGIRGGGFIHETYWGGHSDNYARSGLLGIMEAHERISGTQPRRFSEMVLDSYQNLGDKALNPVACGIYTEEFYAETPHYVRYKPDLVVPWVWGYSLRDSRPVLVPAAVTYYHLFDQRNKFIQECSNGCASGSCLEEAVYYGLLELVERDAFLVSWYAKPTLPEIDPRTSSTLSTRLMVDRLAMYGYDVRLFDARIEFSLPVVLAVAQRRDGGMGTLLFGAGASLDPEEAIGSGLYEIASEVPTFAQDTEAMLTGLTAKAADFGLVGSLSDHAPLFGLPEMAQYAEHLLGTSGPPADLPSVADTYRDWQQERPHTHDLRDDVEYCVDMVVRAGFDVIVVDQTSPEQHELGLRTASVVIPGTLPIDFGWSRQRVLELERTRTVLRRSGRRATDLTAAELNHAPHPFP